VSSSVRTKKRNVLLVALCLIATFQNGCKETAAIVTVELSVSWDQELLCKTDTRNVSHLTVRAECDSGEISETFQLTEPATLWDVPLGRCNISVSGTNLYGRVVSEGTAIDVEISLDSNTPIAVSMQEVSCVPGSICDTDGDQLPDVDEVGLGTNPSVKDHDNDGIIDGEEVILCCSDPKVPENKKECNGVWIKKVIPEYGVAGSLVALEMLRPSDLLPSELKVGGAVLDDHLIDGQWHYGRLGPKAVLDMVVIPLQGGEEGEIDRYRNLFAPLFEIPVPVYQLDYSAAAAGTEREGLMTDVVAMRSGSRGLLIFGTSSSKAKEAKGAIVILHDQKLGKVHRKAIGSTGWQAIDMAANEKNLALLFRVANNASRLLVYDLSKVEGGGFDLPTPTSLKGPDNNIPVNLILERQSSFVQVLYEHGIARFDLKEIKDGGTIAPIDLQDLFDIKGISIQTRSSTEQPLSDDGALVASSGCVGMTYSGALGNSGAIATYISANYPSENCKAGAQCTVASQLFTLSPMSKCTNPNTLDQCTVNRFGSTQAATAIGAPVFDHPQDTETDTPARIHFLTTIGVFSPAANATSTTSQILAAPKVGFQSNADLNARRPLWLARTEGSDRNLFTVDGAQIRRLDPGRKNPMLRDRLSFSVSELDSRATMLVGDADGSVLNVATVDSTGLTSVATVCLFRGEKSICK
jgi:hypothetical protein